MSAPIIPPAGTSPLGLFAPVAFADPAHPPAFLADDIDPATGDLRSVLSGIDPVDAMVITAIRTEYASGASVQDVGNRFREIQKVDDAIEQSITLEYKRCLADLVKRKLITLDKVVVTQDGSDSVSSFALYTNLNTGVQQPVSA